MPALHWAATSAGPLAMNIGEPMTGRDRFCSAAGSAMTISQVIRLDGIVPAIIVRKKYDRASFLQGTDPERVCPRFRAADMKPGTATVLIRFFRLLSTSSYCEPWRS